MYRYYRWPTMCRWSLRREEEEGNVEEESGDEM